MERGLAWGELLPESAGEDQLLRVDPVSMLGERPPDGDVGRAGYDEVIVVPVEYTDSRRLGGQQL